ncbi:AAA family ATPase [Aquimarina sp. ERC-38]|uniref:ATP-binding protein n=1 Tax=Aquimarina sp. ERC-38 TaxID=2949996 RepID=UPI0022457BD7|nr:AAA family ATPase [Aquimarina sp. ERC-38]UZO81631.1 AAA family ATPase [Aquimarina sp. ERC-38]
MINRTLLQRLSEWRANKDRKPLVLRGARQVGKTTLVKIFSVQFEQFIHVNLEKKEDQDIFLEAENVSELIKTISFVKNKESFLTKETLLFIDEIQEVPAAINQLRYFYEEIPQLYVIAAGSLLEMVLSKRLKFPVGRVFFIQVRPFSFEEFLIALNEENTLAALNEVPVEKYVHKKMLQLYHEYALVGGMPEVVTTYAKNRDPLQLSDIYDSLLVSYIDDIEKYSRNPNQTQILRFLMNNFIQKAGERITFGNFSNSNYKSREMGEAFRILEKNQLLKLTYPTTAEKLPITITKDRKPRLQVLDTGLVNYFSKIQHLLITSDDLTNTYNGKIIEHLTGQELLALNYSPLHTLSFWVQENAKANAEVDFIYPYKGKLIPIEVKSGKKGILKSLHIYMSRTNHKLAVRLYAGDIQIDTVQNQGMEYYLMSLPYYLVFKIDQYLNWFENEINN